MRFRVGRGFRWETNAGGGSSPHSKKKGQTTTEYAVAVTLALAVVAGLVVFVGAMRDNISAAGNGVADTFAALAGNVSQDHPEETQLKAYAVYSSYDGSLTFYKREQTPSPGERFNGKPATEIYEGIEEIDATSRSNIPWLVHCNGAGSITKIEVADDGVKPISLAYWFNNMRITSFDVAKLDTSNAMSLSHAFEYCGLPKDFSGVSAWDTSKVLDMSYMFNYAFVYNYSFESIGLWNTQSCTSLERSFSSLVCRDNLSISLDLSHWDTSRVQSLTYTFYYNKEIHDLNVSTWDVSSVKTANQCFGNISNINKLDLSNWDPICLVDMEGMFHQCENLTSIAAKNWNLYSLQKASYAFTASDNLVIDISNWQIPRSCKYQITNHAPDGVVFPNTWI